MKKKDLTPLIMWFSLVLGILILSSVRLGGLIHSWHGYPVTFDMVFISVYLFWMIIELRVSKKDVNTEGKKASDCLTCQLYGLGQALTILTALWFPSIWQSPNVAHLVGLSLFLFGCCYRLWAIHTLGEFYSHRVRTVAHHKIVDSGPYRYTRHPAYAGMIIANTGICIYFFNWVTISIFLFILVPAILLRIAIEERTLFGIEEYSEYARKRKRLIPGIW